MAKVWGKKFRHRPKGARASLAGSEFVYVFLLLIVFTNPLSITVDIMLEVHAVICVFPKEYNILIFRIPKCTLADSLALSKYNRGKKKDKTTQSRVDREIKPFAEIL